MNRKRAQWLSRWSGMAVLGALALSAAAPQSRAAPQNQEPRLEARNLLFNSIEPCRILDTRNAQDGSLLAGETRAFDVVGKVDLTWQGGESAQGCGIPAFDPRLSPRAHGIVVQYMVKNAAAAGTLKVWASDRPEPGRATLSFSPRSLNVGFGVVTMLRQDLPGQDISISASAEADVVAEVVGYYSSLPLAGPSEGLQPEAAASAAQKLIVDADVHSAAAIAGTKISPDFGAQDIVTMGSVGIGTAAPMQTLDVVGSVKATSFLGSGAALTGVTSAALADDSIVNADVHSAAAIAYSKLDLADNLVNADVKSDAAIAYSKLDLVGNIVDADIQTDAAIAGSKISPDFGVRNILTTGSVTAASFSGDGSALTNVPGTQGPAGPQGPPGPPGSGALDPASVATLRWDLLPRAFGDFAVGSWPQGVAFDGANIWVANYDNNNITKLRASDGAYLGTFYAGISPIAIAFDGANIWAANFHANSVTKLRASDGELQGTFAVGTTPLGLAFDGANIWVTHPGVDYVRKLRASDGTSLAAFPVGLGPSAVAFDGANIWVVNEGSNSVTKLRASDGADLGTFAVGTRPRGIAFDGTYIWVTNIGNNNVTRLRASDGAPFGTFAVGSWPLAIAFDGDHMWVVNAVGENVTRLRASDGANRGTLAVGIGPSAIAFDGAHMWVANSDSNTVSKR